ncbi:unnamed protein product, partial [Mesorhabditis belari]|uniref:Apple domain-containing protein n=1 Tax=Mesorhabditis belari TaxID=2138241 RepID=A0AAF3EZ24_9BILA
MLLYVFILLIGSLAARNAHFGQPCQLCRCFVEYTDRDMRIPMRPYAMAFNGYESTEDRCLATCLIDRRCKAVVYGMSGGRQVFTCELYEEIDTRSSPIYSPFINIYIPRGKCPVKIPIQAIRMIPADDSSLKRRVKMEKRAHRKNPFFG